MTLEAILWIARTGAPWRDLPDFFGSWQSAYSRFRLWTRQGLWRKLLHALRDSLADTQWLMIDSTVVRAHQHAAGARGGQQAQALGRSRGGLSTKIHFMCDALGYPMDFILTAGQRADCTQARALLRTTQAEPEALMADKGYDSDDIRENVMQMNADAVIPSKTNRKEKHTHDEHLYAGRHVIENTIGKLKQFRRVATRYDKLASSYAAFVCISAWALYLLH